MKKWFILALIACVAVSVQAKEEESTWSKQEYIKKNKEWSKHPQTGWDFDLEKSEAAFDKMDTDGDGKLTLEEREAGKKKGPPAKSKKDDDTWTKEKFVKKQKEWSKNPMNGWNFNQEKSEARFDELDTNGDGMLTLEEREAGKK